MKSLAVLSLLALTLSLTACSGDGPDAAAEPAGKPAAASGAASPAAAPAVAELPAVPAFDVKPRGVIADVTTSTCDTKAGPVTASGTAVNTGKFTRDIVVVVDWSLASTQVVARGVATVDDVAPGASVDWSLDADLDADAPVSCVTTALAGQLS